MHVLVTGANGFVGGEVVRALLAQGHAVTAVVRSDQGRWADPSTGALRVVSGDLAGDLELPGDLDAIVHAAARLATAGGSVDDLIRDNVTATARLVRFARDRRIRRFIFFSSLSIYGRIDASLVGESTPVQDPGTYGLTKRLGEALLASEAGGLDSLSIRLPCVIGRASSSNWLTDVLAAAREGRDIVVFNPDAPFNNAAHVSDLGRFVCALVAGAWQGCDAVTVGAKGTMPVAAVVQSLVDACGGRSRIRVESARRHSFLVSNARACDRYGYNPMDIRDMLRRFAAENVQH